MKQIIEGNQSKLNSNIAELERKFLHVYFANNNLNDSDKAEILSCEARRNACVEKTTLKYSKSKDAQRLELLKYEKKQISQFVNPLSITLKFDWIIQDSDVRKDRIYMPTKERRNIANEKLITLSHKLAHKFYPNKYKKNKKKNSNYNPAIDIIRYVAIIEGHDLIQHHSHATFDTPVFLKQREFYEQIVRFWKKMEYCNYVHHKHNHENLADESDFVAYGLKETSKDLYSNDFQDYVVF